MKKRRQMRSLVLGSVVGIGLLFGLEVTSAGEVAPGQIIVQLKKSNAGFSASFGPLKSLRFFQPSIKT